MREREKNVMKLVLLTNVMNHYQLALSDALNEQPEISFKFVATVPLNQERMELGFSDLNHFRDYSICSYDNEEKRKEAMDVCYDADIVIAGSAPKEFYHKRDQAGKITFMYSERVYKKPLDRKEILARAILYYFRHGRYKNKYLLCNSAFTAGDYSITRTYINKAYKWGYFSKMNLYDLDDLIEKKKNDKTKIVWSGRFIDWKHPEAAVFLGDYLKKKGYDFEINMIGTGEMASQIQSMINEKKLGDYIYLRGSMPPENVRDYMEKSCIFIFTSDRGEGWGVVLNEAMNSACSVVASHAIGSVPYLVKNRENGLIFQSENWIDMCENVEKLIQNPGESERLGRAAYHTIIDVWNPLEAAKRLVVLIDCLKKGKQSPYKEGPCSPAEILYDDWFLK